MNLAILDELTVDERSSLTLALEFVARILGRDDTSFVTSEKKEARLVKVDAAALNKPRMIKFRASLVRSLYADDLPKDIIDRTVYAVAAGMTTRHDVNRLVANCRRTVESNIRRGTTPDRAWILFYGDIKKIYEAHSVDFPKMSSTLEPIPDEIIAKREERERLQERVRATLNEI